MKTKTIKTVSIITLITVALLSSCSKPGKPVITALEVGTGNSQIGIIGSDLHLEAEVVAEGTINSLRVYIHPEDGGTWEFDSTYAEFSGLKNCTFHKHLVIPLDATEGGYHLHLEVTDMEGNMTLAESELELQAPSDSEAPTIEILSAPTIDQNFSDGQTIHISGLVSDETYLGGLYIGLIRVDQNLSDGEVNSTNTITILHSHDFDTPTDHSFSANIVVGTSHDNDISPKEISGSLAWDSGNYYILVKCKDNFGGNWTFSGHYPIIINY